MSRVVLLALVVALLAGCGDSRDDYCDAVEEHQQELSDIVGSGEPDALLGAVGVFRDLQGKAPSDIRDEWQQVVSTIDALQEALDEAGVDPSTYDRSDPPAGLSTEQRASIDAASRELGGGTTLRALEDLEQEARDVCGTSLTL